ncbi:MAG TPA: phage tail tube protein [Alphaproteobacteria bacterium]|jgi:hypothetical protein
MTTANRVRISLVRETTLGVTPTTPRMRTERITGESLKYAPAFDQSEELRADRMNADPIKVNENTDGGLNFELSYPVDKAAFSERLCSLMFNDWVNTPARDNDGTADSAITGIVASSDSYTVLTGTAFVPGHLVRATGFAIAGNNGIFAAQAGSGATAVVAPASPGLADEAAPPAAARLKVVGFQGDSGDIEATAQGLASTDLDFTTLGLTAGQWLKIGGTATGDKFATAALNAWVRVTSVAQNLIGLDNLPGAWATDDGAGKTLKVFFGDWIRNGVTRISHSTERSFLGQAVPTHILSRGLVVNSMDLSIQSGQKVTGSFDMMGMTSDQGTAAYGSTYADATTNPVMAGSVNVGRIAESGTAIVAPNWAQSLALNVNNSLRKQLAVDSLGAVNIEPGDVAVTGTVQSYFGSNALYAKLLAGTVGALNSRLAKNGQAIVFQLPRVTFTDGSPNAQQKNSDVVLPLAFQASLDTLTQAHVWIDRLEYFE